MGRNTNKLWVDLEGEGPTQGFNFLGGGVCILELGALGEFLSDKRYI